MRTLFCHTQLMIQSCDRQHKDCTRAWYSTHCNTCCNAICYPNKHIGFGTWCVHLCVLNYVTNCVLTLKYALKYFSTEICKKLCISWFLGYAHNYAHTNAHTMSQIFTLFVSCMIRIKYYKRVHPPMQCIVIVASSHQIACNYPGDARSYTTTDSWPSAFCAQGREGKGIKKWWYVKNGRRLLSSVLLPSFFNQL